MAQLPAVTSGFSLSPWAAGSTNLGWPWAREAKRLARHSSLHLFVHVLLTFFQMSFPDVIWSYWEIAGILDRINGIPGHCQTHRWGDREGLAECLEDNGPAMLTLCVLVIFAQTFE